MKLHSIAVGAFLASACVGAADPNSPIRAALDTNYKGIVRAYVNKDFKAFADYMTVDFVAIDPKGAKKDRVKVVSDFSQQRGRLNKINWTKTIRSLKVTGKNSQVIVSGNLNATITFGGKDHTFSLTATSTDDWRRSGLTWKLARSQTTTFEVKIDGQSKQREPAPPRKTAAAR